MTALSRQEGTTAMPFIQGGVYDAGWGVPLKTKAELKRAVAAAPHFVGFESTSPLGPQACGAIPLVLRDNPGTKLTVVGPDPRTDRRWYATIEVAGSHPDGTPKYKVS